MGGEMPLRIPHVALYQLTHIVGVELHLPLRLLADLNVLGADEHHDRRGHRVPIATVDHNWVSGLVDLGNARVGRPEVDSPHGGGLVTVGIAHYGLPVSASELR